LNNNNNNNYNHNTFATTTRSSDEQKTLLPQPKIFIHNQGSELVIEYWKNIGINVHKRVHVNMHMKTAHQHTLTYDHEMPQLDPVYSCDSLINNIISFLLYIMLVVCMCKWEQVRRDWQEWKTRIRMSRSTRRQV